MLHTIAKQTNALNKILSKLSRGGRERGRMLEKAQNYHQYRVKSLQLYIWLLLNSGSLTIRPKYARFIFPPGSSVQSLGHAWFFETPWTAAHRASLSITNSQSPPKPMSIVSVMPSKHPIFCRPLLLLPSIFPSIRVFSNESALRIRWPKYWSFSFNISPSNEHPGLIQWMYKYSINCHLYKALWDCIYFCCLRQSHPVQWLPPTEVSAFDSPIIKGLPDISAQMAHR